MVKNMFRHLWHIVFGSVAFWFVTIFFTLLVGIFGLDPLATVSWKGYLAIGCSALITGFFLGTLPKWRSWESFVAGALSIGLLLFIGTFQDDILDWNFLLLGIMFIAVCVPMYAGSYVITITTTCRDSA